MKDQIEPAFTIHSNAQLTPEARMIVLEELRRACRPPPPAPVAALNLLFEAACCDTGTSQAARNFLFSLAGLPDPTGYRGDGALELRRFDRPHKAAALEVVAWWAGPTQSDEPLYRLLRRLRDRFDPQRSAPTNHP